MIQYGYRQDEKMVLFLSLPEVCSICTSVILKKNGLQSVTAVLAKKGCWICKCNNSGSIAHPALNSSTKGKYSYRKPELKRLIPFVVSFTSQNSFVRFI